MGGHGERGARAYYGGMGAEPPAGSRGRAPGHGVGRGAKPPEAESFLLFARSGTPQIRVLLGIWTRTRAREMLLNVYAAAEIYATVDIFAPGDTPCRFPRIIFRCSQEEREQ